jgi:NTP pyrophosphatase (non-canonical NTP hydrolase)
MSSITTLTQEAHAIAKDRGWWPEKELELARNQDPNRIATCLALIHSEVSEALEDARVGNMGIQYEGEKPIGFDIELADVMIRVLDLAGAMDIDLDLAIRTKMAYNSRRSYRHGGKAI